MAVGTDDAVTGGHDAFFGQEGVLNTHLAHIVEVEDIIFVGKLAALLGLGGALDVLIGDEVIQHDGNVFLVEHTVKARLLELIDGDRGGDIVAQHDIEPGIDELACLDLRQTRMCGQNLLRQSHSHNTLSFYVPWSRCPSYNLSVSHSLDSVRVAAPSVRFVQGFCTCVLLAAAPTTPPCFRHWRRSSSLP